MHKVFTDLARGDSNKPNRPSRMKIGGKEIASMAENEGLDTHDGGPRRLAMSQYGKHKKPYDSKCSGNRFAPLRRFLRSRVGKLWNTVYSEMVEELDVRSPTKGGNLLREVKRMVETGCTLGADGKVYNFRFGSGFEVRGFYVHPKTGVLCYKEHERYQTTDKQRFLIRLRKFGSELESEAELTSKGWMNFRIVGLLVVLQKKPAGWFIHTFGERKPDDVMYWNRNPLTGERTTPVYFKDLKYSSPIYKLSSRQLGRKDLKKYKTAIAGSPF